MSKFAPTIVELANLAEKWNMVAQHIVRQDPERVRIGKEHMTPDVFRALEEINRVNGPLIAQAKDAERRLADIQPETPAELAENFDVIMLVTESAEEEVDALDQKIAPGALRGQEIMAKVFAAALGDDFMRVAPSHIHSQAVSEGFAKLGHTTLAAAFAP